MIQNLDEAINVAKALDGGNLPLAVIDWGGVRDLFDRQALWNEERLRQWLESHTNPAGALAPLLSVRYATQPLLELWGASDLDEATRTYRRLIASLGNWVVKVLEGFRAGKEVVTEQIPSGRDVEYVRPIRLNAPTRQVPTAVVAFVEISAEAAVGNEHRQGAARYQAILEDQTDFIVRYRPDGVRTYVNRAYADFFGGTREELVGKSFLPLVAPQHRPDVEEKIRRLVEREDEALAEEHLSYRHDGTLCWTHWIDRAIFDPGGNLVELQAVGRDITEIKRADERRLEAERQLARARKVEALGALAGGLAHDFNNTLTSMQGYIALIEADPDDASLVREYVELLGDAVQSAAHLTRKLLRLGHREPDGDAEFEVRSVIEGAVRLLRGVVPPRINVSVSVPELPRLSGDANEVTQAIVNLGLNSKDAIASVGLIDISARRVSERGHEWVVITVRDDGRGIPSEAQPRIFEPLFTTKGAGEGHGLGLAMVDICAINHGGRVEVASVVGQGTRVELYLPCGACVSNAVGAGELSHSNPLVWEDSLGKKD